MSATTNPASSRRTSRRKTASPRADDPRVVRSRAAVTRAATTLFLEKGYAGATMEDIAALAGITKRTLYNNYPDKDALFTQIVGEVLAFAEEFARGLRADFAVNLTAEQMSARLHDFGRRLALGVLRPEIISLRRLIIREADAFPLLGAEYYDRAPGQVMGVLASGFRRLSRAGALQKVTGRTAAKQFAYLVVGEPLDRAMLTGSMPTRRQVLASARAGVETFLARYATDSRHDRRSASRMTGEA